MDTAIVGLIGVGIGLVGSWFLAREVEKQAIKRLEAGWKREDKNRAHATELELRVRERRRIEEYLSTGNEVVAQVRTYAQGFEVTEEEGAALQFKVFEAAGHARAGLEYLLSDGKESSLRDLTRDFTEEVGRVLNTNNRTTETLLPLQRSVSSIAANVRLELDRITTLGL